jgi:hypothetical protein
VTRQAGRDAAAVIPDEQAQPAAGAVHVHFDPDGTRGRSPRRLGQPLMVPAGAGELDGQRGVFDDTAVLCMSARVNGCASRCRAGMSTPNRYLPMANGTGIAEPTRRFVRRAHPTSGLNSRPGRR